MLNLVEPHDLVLLGNAENVQPVGRTLFRIKSSLAQLHVTKSFRSLQSHYRVFLLDKDRKWNYSICLLKDIPLKPLMHLTDNAQNNSISCPNPEGMPCCRELSDFRSFVGKLWKPNGSFITRIFSNLLFVTNGNKLHN